MELPTSRFKEEFHRTDAAICLNHAGISPIPQRTAAIIADLAQFMTRRQPFRYSHLEETLYQSRTSCARLVGCRPDEIAFTRNTSEALSFVALGLDWSVGDEIVTTDQEFPSNLVVWLDLARRKGIKVHRVASQPDRRISAESLLAHVHERTRLVTVSSVQFATGAEVDLERIGSALKTTPTLFVVDAVQSLGAMPLDVHAMGIDALAAGGHKWMLAPEGCGLFYLSEKGLATIEPRVMGWHSVVGAGDYSNVRIEPREGILRFEAGTHNVLGARALAESVDLLLEVGIPEVWRRIQTLVSLFVQSLLHRGYRILSPLDAYQAGPSGIMVFDHPNIDTARIHRHLLSHRIEQIPRGGGIRFAPHFYQDQEDVQHVIAVLDRMEP
ncbi:MAG: aminotransferase class V-fold PLP-dependent enzyme [Magnetococcales bacterium]|nr:aminotransferase class V-fold PLP-dependent enzyme [Magnetococcales bacterium]